MLPFEQTRVRLYGDEALAQSYIGAAQRLLFQVKQVVQSSRVPVYALMQEIEGGYIKASYHGGMTAITIDVSAAAPGKDAKRKQPIEKPMGLFIQVSPAGVKTNAQGNTLPDGWLIGANRRIYPNWGGRTHKQSETISYVGDPFENFAQWWIDRRAAEVCFAIGKPLYPVTPENPLPLSSCEMWGGGVRPDGNFGRDWPELEPWPSMEWPVLGEGIRALLRTPFPMPADTWASSIDLVLVIGGEPVSIPVSMPDNDDYSGAMALHVLDVTPDGCRALLMDIDYAYNAYTAGMPIMGGRGVYELTINLTADSQPTANITLLCGTGAAGSICPIAEDLSDFTEGHTIYVYDPVVDEQTSWVDGEGTTRYRTTISWPLGHTLDDAGYASLIAQRGGAGQAYIVKVPQASGAYHTKMVVGAFYRIPDTDTAPTVELVWYEGYTRATRTVNWLAPASVGSATGTGYQSGDTVQATESSGSLSMSFSTTATHEIHEAWGELSHSRGSVRFSITPVTLTADDTGFPGITSQIEQPFSQQVYSKVSWEIPATEYVAACVAGNAQMSFQEAQAWMPVDVSIGAGGSFTHQVWSNWGTPIAAGFYDLTNLDGIASSIAGNDYLAPAALEFVAKHSGYEYVRYSKASAAQGTGESLNYAALFNAYQAASETSHGTEVFINRTAGGKCYGFQWFRANEVSWDNLRSTSGHSPLLMPEGIACPDNPILLPDAKDLSHALFNEYAFDADTRNPHHLRECASINPITGQLAAHTLHPTTWHGQYEPPRFPIPGLEGVDTEWDEPHGRKAWFTETELPVGPKLLIGLDENDTYQLVEVTP